jgi:phosphoglycolate phosphatase-like HAD superfamily hydrolase
VYVGDEVRDIEAARKSGINCISVSWGFNTKELLQKHSQTVVSSPTELLQAIKG